jgi:hypothetical protein
MARTIVITSKHQLGTAAVKARVSERFAALHSAYIDRLGGGELRWEGDVGHAWAATLGQRGTAAIHAGDTDLRIEITLPLLLAPMAGLIESIIRNSADALHPAPATAAAA